MKLAKISDAQAKALKAFEAPAPEYFKGLYSGQWVYSFSMNTCRSLMHKRLVEWKEDAVFITELGMRLLASYEEKKLIHSITE